MEDPGQVSPTHLVSTIQTPPLPPPPLPQGRGRPKFAPQGSWRQYPDSHQDDGGEWLAAFPRPHPIPFPAPGTVPVAGKGQKQAQTLVERAQELWGEGSTYNPEVVSGIFQNIKKSK